jgi:hypothetical protein
LTQQCTISISISISISEVATLWIDIHQWDPDTLTRINTTSPRYVLMTNQQPIVTLVSPLIFIHMLPDPLECHTKTIVAVVVVDVNRT